MSEGKRPGGLTALAVINFIFGGLGALGILAMGAMFAILGAAAEGAADGDDEAARGIAEAWEQLGVGYFYLMFALGVVSTILLIASGVGYLQQKNFLGRKLGTAYALVAIVSSLIGVAMVPADAGGGFNIGTIIGLVYPVLTLLLLNTTFKEDFVRP